MSYDTTLNNIIASFNFFFIIIIFSPDPLVTNRFFHFCFNLLMSQKTNAMKSGTQTPKNRKKKNHNFRKGHQKTLSKHLLKTREKERKGSIKEDITLFFS